MGKFRYVAEIGHGGMSNVFLATTQSEIGGVQKLIVVKTLKEELSDDPEFREMFLSEARLSARLCHPNVVTVYDVGDDGSGRYYISMEYVRGQNFERIRKTHAGKIGLYQQLQMLVDVLSGLHHAHELTDYDGTPLSIVHRDVSPSNVVVTYDGQVKLLDFGIAKMRESTNNTGIGRVRGKIRYMSPEYIGRQAVDRSTDIYSAGVMMWEILSGKSLWNGLNENEILHRVCREEVPALPASMPDDLKAICLRALSRDLSKRYFSAETMRDDIADALLQYEKPERTLGNLMCEIFATEKQEMDAKIHAHMNRRSGEMSRISMEVIPQIMNTASTSLSIPLQENVKNRPTIRRLMIVGVTSTTAIAIIIWTLMMWKIAHPDTVAPQVTSSVSVQTPIVEPVVVGMSAPFSGPSGDLGRRMKLGLDVAFADSKIPIKLVALDDGYDANRALNNVKTLIDEKHVVALIGNVGTPTAKNCLPYVLEKNTLFFGAFTGAQFLRRHPPDRFVLNYRAGYEEETSMTIKYLLKTVKVPESSIVVFAQNDSFGEAGVDGVKKTLRDLGHEASPLIVKYERNTIDVDTAVNQVVEYNNATIKYGGETKFKHPVKAVVMITTYKPAAAFVKKLRDRGISPIFTDVSFVGAAALAEELKQYGAGYGVGVIVTQVVPYPESGATGVIRYREALKKYHPEAEPDFVSLEGYVVGLLFLRGVETARASGEKITPDHLVDAFETIKGYDPGLGGELKFGVSEHQASHRVWGSVIDEKGEYRSLEME